jgi:glyoxylase-like metal-dependent hydrolase (beta-lactamase superfamily II)
MVTGWKQSRYDGGLLQGLWQVPLKAPLQMKSSISSYNSIFQKPCLLVFLILLTASIDSGAQDPMPANPTILLRVGQDQKKATRINDAVFQAIGFSNTFMVTTEAGNVIIDTSMPFNAALHKRLLTAESDRPIKYIILTHAHGDHTGGVSAWKQTDTKIVAQENHKEFQHYTARLDGFYALRNAAQFALPTPASTTWPGNYGAKIEPVLR